MPLKPIATAAALLGLILLASCGGSGSGSTLAPPPATYTVGGTVSGLVAGTSLTLTDNGSDATVVSASGSFTFTGRIAEGGSYSVAVSTQPVAQDCAVTNASGSGVAANVGNVTVACTARQQYAYVLNNGLNSISEYQIGSDGRLSNPHLLAPVPTGSSPETITVDPSRHFLYVTNLNDNTVSQYRIQSDGTLLPNTPATVAVGNGPNGFAIDPAGKYAYVVCTTDQTVTQYSIGSNGTLTKTAATAVLTGVHPWDISVTPDDKYVYVTDHGTGLVGGTTLEQYAVASDGSLSALTPATVTTDAYPTGHAVDASGTHLYVANAGTDAVSQYSIGSDGQLAALVPATVPGGSQPDFIAIHPSGKFAYAPNFTPGTTTQPAGTVSQYAIATDGTLSALPGASPATGLGPVWLSFDAFGRYAYVINLTMGTVSEYSVGIDGTLSLMVEAALAGPNGQPYAMAIAY